MNQRFHFTFGPVQGFVAEARRTRDLWAGSWLLSYLAESAIAAAEQADATLVLPHRTEADRREVTMRRGGSLFGGFPNRFTADAPDPVRAAQAAGDGLRQAWKGVADAVCDRYVTPAEALGEGTREIWDRQVESFWETAWVVGEAATLAARKNVRLMDARVEPGDHCSLMGDLQELSGHYGRGARERQREFWNRVRARTPTLDLEENERLSAIALIKRLFAHVAEDRTSARRGTGRRGRLCAHGEGTAVEERVHRRTRGGTEALRLDGS
jgi:CRISPR-associated protein Cmr2